MLLQLFVDNTDLRCQKRLWILCFPTTSIKIWRSAFVAFSPLHLSEPLRKQKVVVCDLWLVDFDPFCVFLCFKVRCFVFENRRKNYQAMFVYRSDLGQNLCHFFFLPYFTNIFCISFYKTNSTHPVFRTIKALGFLPQQIIKRKTT